MPKIAVIGGTGYLASLIKNQNKLKNNKFYLSRKKNRKIILTSQILKNKDFFKKFDFIVHLLGPNKSQIEKNRIN